MPSASASACVVAMNSLLLAGAGSQPDEVVDVLVELADGLVGLLGVLPLGIALFALVVVLARARVVDGGVDLALHQGRADHLGRAELRLVLGLDAVGVEHLDDHRAQEAAFGVEQRAHAHHGPFGRFGAARPLSGLFVTAGGKAGRERQHHCQEHDQHQYSFHEPPSLSCSLRCYRNKRPLPSGRAPGPSARTGC